MIDKAHFLFKVPTFAYTKCQFSRSDHSAAQPLKDILGISCFPMQLDYEPTLNIYFNDRIALAIKEIRDKPRNWTILRMNKDDTRVQVAYRLLFIYKCLFISVYILVFILFGGNNIKYKLNTDIK